VSLPPTACWFLTVAFACSAGSFLHAARTSAGAAERISRLLHAVMCLVMITMTWPWGARAPHGPQVAVLSASLVWFVASAVRARGMMLAVKAAHHTLMAAVMAWMVVMPVPAMPRMDGANTAMGRMSGPAPGAVTLAAYCLLAAVVRLAEAGTATGSEPLVRRLSTATGHAVMSLGTGVLALAMS
jgi:hypothetical protein